MTSTVSKGIQPSSIEKAVEELLVFFECDLYTKFRPEVKFPVMKNGKRRWNTLYRTDPFKNEEDFIKYLRAHFEVLEKEIISLIGKKEFKKVRS